MLAMAHGELGRDTRAAALRAQFEAQMEQPRHGKNMILLGFDRELRDRLARPTISLMPEPRDG